MSGTRATTSNDGRTLTPLARGMQTDRETDRRDCPHDCHGTLELTENDRVVCGLCRCTPDGVYLPPETHGPIDRDPTFCSQFEFFFPWGSGGENGGLRGRNESDRQRYGGSGRVRLYGGFERVYDDNHPMNVGRDSEYTFDLSTL